jgi:hypothetical protein
VRVTGLLLFDSTHFFHEPLTRDTSWEIHSLCRVVQCHAQVPKARHNNGPPPMLFPAVVMIGITWDSAATPRLAIVTLIIAIVCFSLALLFFLRRC